MVEERDYAAILRTAFDKTIKAKYDSTIPPPAYVTPFGIKHLDALLGGGLTSSAPIAFSSTPESGKSTVALQFCALFQQFHPDSVVVYLDTESAAGGESPEISDRVKTFGINPERFLYYSVIMDLKQMFDMMQELIDIKLELQKKTGKEVFVLFVLDSIAAMGSSKDVSTEDVNSIIGFKARELTFTLSKYRQHISMQRVSFIIIDQVRANMQIQSRFQAATEERGVGTFGNYKSATNVNALQHQFRQWLWLSKGEQLKPTDPLGVDGWVINLFAEKNKLAPSKYSVPLVFDKKFGIHPRLSEYYFMSHKTKTEKRYWPDPKKLPYPLLITPQNRGRVLEVFDPNTGESLYKSDIFPESKFLDKYNSDETFRQWFDYGAYVSAEQRIKNALFRENPGDGKESIADYQGDDQAVENAMVDSEPIDESEY